MTFPSWLAKFASRKLAALAAVLLAHYLISRGMAAGQADQLAEAIAQGLMAIVDGFVAWKYLDAQGKIDEAEKKSNAVPKDAGQVGLDAVIAVAKAQRQGTVTIVSDKPEE